MREPRASALLRLIFIPGGPAAAGWDLALTILARRSTFDELNERPKSQPEPAAILRGRKLRATPARIAILKRLAMARRPLSIDEIHRGLPRSGDWATVFRCLTRFEAAGLVARCDFGDGQSRFELLAGGCGAGHHHHHLICRACGKVQHVEECDLGDIERALEERHGFSSVSHSLEFFGLCPRCRGKGARPRP
ncbi:MAG TPA: Fur family transcriptional regulator [Verrucomicrobiae bacterium]|nr:Fur family transcriptional regulator [Verrucomicrobiae bacterium]